ncbi:MAG: hypothetical protein ACE5JZ_10545 [Kiloniellales bacterium]
MTYLDVARCLGLWSFLLLNVVAFPVLAQLGANKGSVEARDMGAAAQLDATDAYRLALLKMKGHLGVARALLQMRAPGADYYMRDPVQEIFQDTEAELEGRNAPFTADILQELEHASATDPVSTLAAIESAVTAINGSFAQTGAMNAKSVLALSEALLREAVAKYAEAVRENEVVDLRKYQSGRGFATEAEALVRYSSRLKGRPGHEELLKVVTLIRQAWPGVIPPPIVFDPPSVAGRLEEAVATMDQLR